MSILEAVMDDSNLVANWGLTVTAGYIFTFLLSFNPLGLQYSMESQIVAMWFVLMSFPIGTTVKKFVRDRDIYSLAVIWAGAIFLGLIGNIYTITSVTNEFVLTVAYFQKWFLLPALLFGYTSYVNKGFSKKLYGSAAILNAVMGLALFALPVLTVFAFPVAALIQGMPMVVDWYHHR